MTTFPTALAYYLVLVAASGLGLLAINRAVSAGNENAKQLRTTLLVVFFVQLSLLTLSLLIDNGYLLWFEAFPLIFSALNFVTLVWITWACVSPNDVGWRKNLPLILTLAAFLAGVLSVVYATTHFQAFAYDGTWLDTGWTAATILLLLVGMVMVLTRRHPFKLERFLVLLIASLGYLVNLSDWIASAYPLSIIFTQLLYYPLLTSLAWQTQRGSALPSPAKAFPTSPQMAEAFLELNLQTEQQQIRNALTHSLSIFLMSDLLGLVERTSEGNLRVSNTYDLIREAWLPAFELIPEQVPQLVAHFEDGLPLSANSAEQLPEEKSAVIQAMGYNTSGGLLIYPLKSKQEVPKYGLLCLTPYTNHALTPEDQSQLSFLSENIVRVLDNSTATDAQARAVEELRINLNQIQRQNAHLGEDLERHQKLLAELRQEYLQVKNRYTKETQLWAERQKFLEGKLADLEGTLQEQAAAFAEVESLRQQKTELEAALTKTNAKLTSLKQALASAQDVLSGVVLAPFPTAEPEVKEESEMLTGAQAAAAIEATLKAITNNLDSHTIQLENRLEALPLVPPSVLATVQKVLQSLVSNAIAASPQGSSISVKLLPSEDQSLPESLEIRITDQGGGLSEAAQSAFLSLLKGAENDLPQSIGDAQALQQAVALVEAAGGHWWIHTEPSRSSTYRISLPLNEQDVLS